MNRLWQALTAAFACVIVGTAQADVLWDQSNYDPFGAGVFNSESGEPPFGLTIHSVNDVTVDGSGWTIDTITTYYSLLDGAWGDNIGQGYVHIFDKSGPLPIDGMDDPSASPLVSMTGVNAGDHWEVVATGLALDLDPGEYWIGITPIAPSGPFGPEIHMGSSTFIGAPTASYDVWAFPTPMWFNFSLDVDAAILIEGSPRTPTPVAEGSWGEIKSMFRSN